MPSAEFCTMTTSKNHQAGGPDFQISSKDVEGLVLEIKENLRLSAVTASGMKALPCSHISRKSSRASPYLVPSSCDFTMKMNRRKQQQQQQQDGPEDPYELLQKLLRDGSLVNEAVRRVKLGLSPKQRYFYESDDESSPVILGLFADN